MCSISAIVLVKCDNRACWLAPRAKNMLRSQEFHLYRFFSKIYAFKSIFLHLY